MRRISLIAALCAPVLILGFFWLQPALDPQIRVPILHFYIVTFTAFSATVVSFLLIAALGNVARPRHVLAAVAFGVMGSLFSIHGLTTPGAILHASHPIASAVSWSSSLTLFSGGVIFALASLDRPRGFSQKFMLRLIIGAAAGVMLFVAVVVVTPHLLESIEANLAPWHRRIFFFFSFVVWLFAAVQLWGTWRETGNRLDGALALVAGLLTQATMSMHLFPLWNLSWWLYHFLLLASFLLTAFTLFVTYEQAREFHLSRYFLGAAAILTMLLALVASYLFTEFAETLLATAPSGVVADAGGTSAADMELLSAAVVRVRYTGLFIAAGTMGLLFMALWLVVRRADGIIAARSRELAIAYRDLRESEAMRDDLAHMIVHDLRTPLTAILTSLGLLQRLPSAADGGTHERIVVRTRRAAERLDVLIDEILMVSKMEKGELQLRREDVALVQLLEQQLDPYFLQASAEDKQLHLDCPVALQAFIDPLLTGRVVENLVNNAFKYTMRGGQIIVSVGRDNGALLMSVRDDGEGIPDAFKEQIFGKYKQAPEREGRPLRKGTGLGLAFCRLAIEAQGGKIWVEDAPGGGSNFRVKLPMSVASGPCLSDERTTKNYAITV